MALGFIKKVFSFGKKDDEATKPSEVVETQAAAPAVQPISPLEGEMSAKPTEGGAPTADAPAEAHDVDLTKEEAIERTEWDAGLPDPEPAAGVSDETAQEFAAEHAPSPEPVHVTDVDHEQAEALADWDAGVPEPEPEAPTPLSPLEGEMSAQPTEGDAPDEAVSDEAPSETAPLAEPSPHHRLAEPETSVSVEDAVAPVPALPKGFASASDRKVEPAAPAPQVKQSWFQRLKAGLFRTSSQLTQQISSLFTKRKLDDDTLEELEELLIRADLGVETAMRVTGALSAERYGRDVTGEDVSRIMAGEIEKVLAPVAKPLELDLNHKPHVILVVGVNGTGKTTTIGKLAAKLSGAGLKVMLAAGDTFRAAAIEQLKIWAGRTGSEFIGTQLGADAAGLAYDAYKKAIEKKSDVLIIDTAGRLQNKTELMAELEKIVRVLGKLDPDAPHTVLQTLDATTGQNALQQVEIFRNVAGVSGLVMTKLDGTARGGILVAIAAKHKLPVYFIGVGEGIDDLEPFEAKDFASAIAGIA
ncbi:signal recognition particle-docking protein FtsY [Rhizobium sp. C4]|uniref:signal recognition particle-docking protein FtsY n=1 Tax=Rhizobium sp. C4 TaxID=1349800 RepID=UPI001E534664|nr:signal recognition particle-docking protein FtsY [Rhizobium sp. C4]MCD2175801.1 signal recognition particle-docking protein FtsY [Rhizobium sp. C4]